MAHDEEWMTLKELNEICLAEQNLDDRTRKCHERNDRAEALLADRSVKRAEKIFSAVDESLAGAKSEDPELQCMVSLEQARASLGLALCQTLSIPAYTWESETSEVDAKRDSDARSSWADALEYFGDALACCDECEPSDDASEVEARAMLGYATALDRIYAYDCLSSYGGGEEDYYSCGEDLERPDAEYVEVVEFLKPLAKKGPDRFEPLLLDAMSALARWQRQNCDITNNAALYGAGEFDHEDCARRTKASFDLMGEVLVRRRKLAAKDPKHRAALIDALDDMVDQVIEGRGRFSKVDNPKTICQLAALEPEVRAGLAIARELAAAKRTRYAELRKRTSDRLATITGILARNNRASLPALLWESPLFAARERWDGVGVTKGAKLPRTVSVSDELKVPADDWKLPLLISSHPELIKDAAIRARFAALAKEDGKGRYEDSWTSCVLLVDDPALIGSVNPWAFVLMSRPKLARYGADLAKFNGYSACRLLARQPAFADRWNLKELADRTSTFWKGVPEDDYEDALRELAAHQPQLAKARVALREK